MTSLELPVRDRPWIPVVSILLMALAVVLVVRDVRHRRAADRWVESAEAIPEAATPGPPGGARGRERVRDEAPPPVPELSEEEYERLVEAARQLTAPPEGFDEGVHCRLARTVGPSQGYFLRSDGRHAMGQFPAYTSGDVVSLLVNLPADRGFLHVPGYQPVWVSWTTDRATGEARCVPEPVPLLEGEALVRGVVRNAEGEPEGRVWVEGCAGHALTRGDGSYELDARPGVCEVQAFRLDGLFTARGPRVETDPAPGEVRRVDLEVPDFPTAGLGIAIRHDGQGIVVLETVEGSDAWDQGLRPGDRVISIDGQPTAALELEEFVDLALGREGTGVELVVSRGGEEQTLELTRRTLEP